jgi:hypothetical protein
MKLTLRLNREGVDAGGSKGGSTTRTPAGRGGSGKMVVTTTPVDARYASSYNFSAEMTSKVKTKLVPVPPPAILDERIRALLEQERGAREVAGGPASDEDSRSIDRQALGGPVFDGIHCYEVAGSDAVAASLKAAFTVEAWVSPSAKSTGGRVVVGLGRFGDNPRGWVLSVEDRKIRVVLVRGDSSKATSVIARASAQVDQWQHLAASYDGAKLLLHVDGRLSNGSDEPSGAIDYPVAARLLIGGDGAASSSFDGRIDDVRLWSRARTGSEIKSTMRRRLRGDEAGLVAYWRFDRSNGDIVPDQTAPGDTRRNAGKLATPAAAPPPSPPA